MKRFSKISLIIAFISLIGFIQLVVSYNELLHMDETYNVETITGSTAAITTIPLGYPGDQEYKAYQQVVVRDKNNQLASVTESINTWKVPTFFPNGDPAPLWIDTVFYNTLKKNYQTAIIDSTKYEKVEYYNTFETNRADSDLWLCANVQVYGEICMKSLYARAPRVLVEEGDVVTEKWTILRLIS